MKLPEVPFMFGRVVSAPHFINRESELEHLKTNLLSGVNTILISPRRWGKSSLVHKAVSELSRKVNSKFCTLDLFNIRTEKEFYETYTREVLKCTSSRWEEWVESGKKFLKAIVPRFSLGIDPYNDFSISFDAAPTPKAKSELLNLPEEIAKEKKLKVVVCVDEFQNLMFYDDPLGFQKTLRSAWQKHSHVTYCLYGSKRHMIIDLFENKSMPFYKFGELIFLPKIEMKYWLKYISDSFSKTGKLIDQAAVGEIVNSVQSHPYFVQQLARKVWVISGKKSGVQTVQVAVDELLHENSILYQREVEGLSNAQLNFLHAVCDKVEQLSAGDTISKYNLGSSANVIRVRNALEQKEVLDLMNPYPEFIDPLFEQWLKNIYFHDR